MGITKKHIHSKSHLAVAELFKALAHPARIAIVENLLEHRNLNCKELLNFIQLSQSTISGHLKILHSVGILDVVAVGNEGRYTVNKGALEEIILYTEKQINLMPKFQNSATYSYSSPFFEVLKSHIRGVA